MQRYERYKDSGVDWIGEIPTEWTTPWANYGFKLINQRSENGNETLLTVSEHKGVKLRSESNVTMFMAESYQGYKLCQPGDLVINSMWAWSRGLGFSKYHGIVSTAYSVYRPDHEKYDFQYLNYLLRTERYVSQYLIASKGIWISRLILSDWSFLRLPLYTPPTSTQTAIANFLDRKTALIDQAIAQKGRLIDLLRERQQIVIQQAVTRGLDPDVPMKDSGVEWIGEVPEDWRISSIKYLSSKIGDGIHGTPQYTDDTNIHFINGNNLKNGEIKINNKTKTVSRQECDKYRTPFTENTILLSINGTIGNTARYKGQSIMLGKSAAYINLHANVDAEYVRYFLESSSFKKYCSLEVSGSTIHNLSLQSINDTAIPLPSIELQGTIALHIKNKCDSINSAVNKQKIQITKLKEYRATLIDAAVTGKIKVEA